MINWTDSNVWMVITQAVGAVGTIASVLWAIHVYRKANSNKILLDTKDCILKIPEICSDVNRLLSEPFLLHWAIALPMN